MSVLIAGRRATGAPTPAARLQLTSLVDMMVILVVFLLKSFSAEGQLVTPAAGLELPVSTINASVPAGLVIEIGPERLWIDGRDLMATAAVATDSVALAAALGGLAAAGPRAVVVQCDRRHDFEVLGTVLRACGRAELDDLSLLVIGGES